MKRSPNNDCCRAAEREREYWVAEKQPSATEKSNSHVKIYAKWDINISPLNNEVLCNLIVRQFYLIESIGNYSWQI